jgi:predicted Zn-dependent protease
MKFLDRSAKRRSTTVLAVVALLAPVMFVSPALAGDKEKDPDEIGNRQVDKGINFYSIEKEIALGKQMAQEVERQAKIVDDPIIAEYVNRIGQNLVRNSDAKVPFTIKVIDSEEINAFALPGGFFFVNTGILLNADNEAEMAGVMAHEIAHVAARHGTRQASRGELVNYGSIPLIFLGGWAGYGIRQAAGLAVPMGFLKFSRGFESEADMLGLEYMYKAGYDPTCFVDFFEKIQSLEKRKPGTMSKIFSDHPPTGDRITRSQEIIQKYLKEKPEYVVSTSEFNDVKARTMAMHNRRAIDTAKDAGRPTLRRNPNGQIDSNGNDTPATSDSDDRPTLKRRD